MKSIQFQHCKLVIVGDYCCTTFLDGAKLHATPEDTDEYRATAQDLGYGTDTGRLCREHEASHSYLAAVIGRPWSVALWNAAHELPPTEEARDEEALVLQFQRYLTGQREPESLLMRELVERAKELLR